MLSVIDQEYRKYRLASLSSPPNATTVLMFERASSAIELALDTESRCLVTNGADTYMYLEFNTLLVLAQFQVKMHVYVHRRTFRLMITATADMMIERLTISVSFQLNIRAMMRPLAMVPS